MNGNVNDIIQSGILDLYVAGALTLEEILEVEHHVATEPEIAAEVMRLQRTVEQYAQLHSVTPRPELRSRILQAVENAAQQETNATENTKHNEQPVLTQVRGSGQGSGAAFVEPRSTQPDPTQRAQRQASRGWLMAASIAFMIGLMPGVYYYVQYSGVKSELAQTQVELADAKSNQSVMASKASYMESTLEQLTDSNMMRVPMPGTPKAASSFATVFWNKGTQEVMLDLRKMPNCPAGHDYQLWAIVDGKPVDLGVFNPERDTEKVMKMHAVGKPQMFAVTLEPTGGSPTPTLDKMVVAGAVTKS